MKVEILYPSDGRTNIKVTESSGAGAFQEQRFRLYAADYNGSNPLDSGLTGGVESLKWSIYIEDYANKFITPYPNQTTGTFSVALEKRYTASWMGSTSWREVEKQTYSYTIRNNSYTQPSISMTISPVDLSNGYYMTGVSSVQANFSGSGKLGASVTSYKLTVENKDYTEPYKTDKLATSGNVVIKGTVTDSRGFTNTTTQTIQVLANMPSLDAVTFSTNYVDGLITYKFTPPNNVFYSRLLLQSKVGNNYTTEKTINIGTANGSTTKTYSFVAGELSSIYNKYPNTKDVTLRFVLQTYKDSAYSDKMAEEYSKEVTLNIPENDDTKPIINSITTAPNTILLNNSNLYVRDKNGVKTTIAASGKYNATITSAKWTLDGVTYENGASSTALKSSGNVTISVTVTDSRGFKKTQNATAIVYEYLTPAVDVLEIYRAQSDGTANDEGEYLYIRANRRYSALDGSNKCKLRYRIKTEAGSFGGYQTLLAETDTKNNYSDVAIGGLNSQIVYRVEISAIDSFGEENIIAKTIPTASIYMDRNGSLNSIAFGGYAQEENAMEVHFDGIFYNKLIVNNDGYGILLTSPGGNVFQLTVDNNGNLKVTQATQTFSLRKE